MKLTATLAALALAAGLAGAAPAADKPADAKPAAERRICRSEMATGSIMPRRVCHTKAEWDQIATHDAADSDRFMTGRDRAGVAPGR